MGRQAIYRGGIWLVLGALALGGCQRAGSFSRSRDVAATARASGSGGNGGTYDGRVAYFRYDPANPCPTLGTDGKPLANGEIDVTQVAAATRAELVRDACAAVQPPTPIPPAELQAMPDGGVLYRGQRFAPGPIPNPFPGWARRIPLSVNGPAVGGDLADFPLDVTLTSARANLADFAAGGADLRFADAFGHPLAFELEPWSPTAGAHAWVRLPKLHADAPDTIYLYYKNPAAPPAAGAAWEPGWAGVYHLGGSLADSSARGNALAAIGGPAAAGGATSLSAATPSYLGFPSGFIFSLGSETTLEVWFRASLPGALLGSTNQAYPGGLTDWENPLYIDQGGHLAGGYYQPSSRQIAAVTSSATVTDGRWHQAALALAGTRWTLYLDGAIVGAAGGTEAPAGFSVSEPFQCLGLGELNGWPGAPASDWTGFTGQLDEARVSAVARPAAWIRAEWLGEQDTLVAFGAAETQP